MSHSTFHFLVYEMYFRLLRIVCSSEMFKLIQIFYCKMKWFQEIQKNCVIFEHYYMYMQLQATIYRVAEDYDLWTDLYNLHANIFIA